MSKKTLSEIYDEEFKRAPHIASSKQIAINAMFEVKKVEMKRKCKTCEYNGKNVGIDDRINESGSVNEFVSEHAN